jgi:hypothetical protein
MVDRNLDIAFWNYDRTRALADGTVTIPGVEATFHSARIVAEIFEGVIRESTRSRFGCKGYHPCRLSGQKQHWCTAKP